MKDEDYRLCQRAEKMLEDPDVEKILVAMKEECVEGWLGSKDPEEREHLWHAARSVDDFRVMLHRLADAKNVEEA
jgi:hypothetical protein